MSFLWFCLKLVENKCEKSVYLQFLEFGLTVLIHYLCMCIPWQCEPRASLTLKGLYSHTERWKDCSVRFYCINTLTATWGDFLSDDMFSLMDLNRLDGQSLISLWFRRSCNLVCKSAAKDFLEEVFGKKLMTPSCWYSPLCWGYSSIAYCGFY